MNARVRKVDTNGIITTVAGDGKLGNSGDGGPAVQAKLWYPSDVAIDASGNLHIADCGNSRIRKVDTNGVITTVAGNGIAGYGGNGGAATQAKLNDPEGVAVDRLGNLYIADTNNHLIRNVDKSGILTTMAGSLWKDWGGNGDYWGDGGPAIRAALNYPSRMAVSASNELYIADRWNHRIRLVMPKRSTITGRVTDSSTGLLLSDVMVAIKDSLRTFTTKTDSNGTYTISGLDKGSFTATFVKSGYAKYTVAATLNADDTKTLNIQLIPIPPLNLTITSPQDGVVLNSSPILRYRNGNPMQPLQ